MNDGMSIGQRRWQNNEHKPVTIETEENTRDGEYKTTTYTLAVHKQSMKYSEGGYLRGAICFSISSAVTRAFSSSRCFNAARCLYQPHRRFRLPMQMQYDFTDRAASALCNISL